MKHLKKILSLFLALCTVTAVFTLFTACDSDTSKQDKPAEEKTGYSLTLVDSENNPVVGATVMITDSAKIFEQGKTDEKGTFSTDKNGDNLGVMIVSLPEGYIKPTAISGVLHAVYGDKKDITITVNKENKNLVTYSVKVIDQNDAPVAGVSIQLCPNGTCLADGFITDDQGIITKDMTPDLPVDVKLVTLPDGYTKPEAVDDNGYHGKIEVGQTEIIIVVTKN